MQTQTTEALTQKQFIQTFNRVAAHRHRYEVFRDFVTLSAISLHNAIHKVEALEQEYLNIVARYKKDEVEGMCHLLAILVMLLEPEPRDILGGLYMDLNLGNDATGQFFTPPEVSQLMAEMMHGDQLANLEQPFITMSEPACGAGGMVILPFCRVLRSRNVMQPWPVAALV